MVAIRLDVEGVAQTLAAIRKIEPDGLKALRRDIKNDPGVSAAISSIESEIPVVAPLSGMMNHNGRTQYRIPRVSTSLRSPRVAMSRQESSLVTLVVSSPRGGIGFEIVDMAGRGSGGRTARGRAMIANLAKKASRYVYPGFEKKKQNVADGVQRILDKYAQQANVKLKVM
jgi:hypothetical protein